MTVLFFLHRIGPYHHARFMEANKVMKLIVVETRPQSEEYPWIFEASGGYQIEKYTAAVNGGGAYGRALKRYVSTVIGRHKPDVVVTTGWAGAEYHAVVLEAVARKIPRVVISDSRYEDEPRKFYKELSKKIILKAFSGALVAGTSSRNYIVRLGMNPNAVFQPWDVVDNQYFLSRNDSAGVVDYNKRALLCISRFIPKKNLLGLIHAFARYRNNGGNRLLTLLGSGILEESIKDTISAEGLEKVVRLQGFIQYDKLPHYLSQAWALIIPSTTDQWGLVVNEAMAAGLPVLVSEQCGCAVDLLQPGKNGYTFNPFDVQSIVNTIVMLDQKSEQDWLEMSEVSKNIIKQWDLTDFADGLAKACRHAINFPSGRPWRLVHAYLSGSLF